MSWMPWNTLIPSGNIYSKPKELGSKEKKMFLLEAHLMNTQTLQKKNLPSQDGDNGKEVPLTCSQAREGHIRAKITLWHRYFTEKLAPLQIPFSADSRVPPSEMLCPHSVLLLFRQTHCLIFYLIERIRNARR